MKAYRYHFETFLYEGEQERQIDPVATAKLGYEVYLMPADCTLIEPPEEKEGFNIKWNGEDWEYEEIPKEEEYTAPELTLEDKINQLDAQYASDKATLQEYYVTYMINGDTDGMAEIKEELEALAEQYDEDLAALKTTEEEEEE